MTRFNSKYPDIWKEIAKQVKDEAGWCGVRCGHPHDPKAGLSSCAVMPIKRDMTLTTEGYQVGAAIGFFVALQTNATEWYQMSNRKLFRQFVAVPSAVLTLMPIAVTRLVVNWES